MFPTYLHFLHKNQFFLEYFKEAGDLYNWCTILEKEMNSLENIFIPGKNPEPLDEKEEENKNNKKRKIKLEIFEKNLI